jgi:hypothetical protein
MTEHFPKYDGIDPFKYPIREFVRQVKKALIINNQPAMRWPIILDTLITGEAKTEYDQAIQDGTIANPDGGADENARLADATTCFNNRITWLEECFHTLEVQEDMKSQVGYLA